MFHHQTKSHFNIRIPPKSHAWKKKSRLKVSTCHHCQCCTEALMVIKPQEEDTGSDMQLFVQHHIKVQACRVQSNPAWPNRGCSPCFECLPYSCCWCTPPAETCSSCERSQRNLKNTRAETYSQCIISLCRSRYIQDHKVLAMMHV